MGESANPLQPLPQGLVLTFDIDPDPELDKKHSNGLTMSQQGMSENKQNQADFTCNLINQFVQTQVYLTFFKQCYLTNVMTNVMVSRNKKMN